MIGKVDTLEGLKENVIVGRLIPAGTGGALMRNQLVADKRDSLILEERAKQAELAGEGDVESLPEPEGDEATEGAEAPAE